MLIIEIFRATSSWLFDGNMLAINSSNAAWIVPPTFELICNPPPLVGSFWCLEKKEKNMPISFFWRNLLFNEDLFIFQSSPTPRCSTSTQRCNTPAPSGTPTPISIDESGGVDDDPSLHDDENEEEEINEISEKSTKMPLKVTTSRKRQAEEEFNLIKGLSSAIQERAKKKPDMSSDISRKNSAYG